MNKKENNMENNDTSVETKESSEKLPENRLLDNFDTKKFTFSILKTIAPFVVIFLFLEILLLILHAAIPTLSYNLYPLPHDIIAETWNDFFPGADSAQTSVLIHIGWSFLRVLIGFLIGVISGLIVGIIMGYSKWIDRLLNPIFSLMISIPTLAWVPILLTIFGLNTKTIIITIILSCFFPIVYSTNNGIRSIDKKLLWAARMMEASRFEIFFDVLLPGSLVSVVAGLRLAIGYSWRAIVGAEMLIALTNTQGIGYFIIGGKIANNIPQVIIGIMLIALGGLLLDTILMKPIEYVTIRKWGMITKSSN